MKDPKDKSISYNNLTLPKIALPKVAIRNHLSPPIFIQYSKLTFEMKDRNAFEIKGWFLMIFTYN